MTPRAAILRLVALYRREPARFNTTAATILGPLLVRVGLDVDNALVLVVVGAVLNGLAGELTRRLVVPVPKALRQAADVRRLALREAVHAYENDPTWEPANPDVKARKA